MNDQNPLNRARVRELLAEGARQQILVLGDIMLDWFIWGRVDRISPEAPVPVLEFQRENFMPGGAANVARNLAVLKNPVRMIAPVGRDSRQFADIEAQVRKSALAVGTRAGQPPAAPAGSETQLDILGRRGARRQAQQHQAGGKDV